LVSVRPTCDLGRRSILRCRFRTYGRRPAGATVLARQRLTGHHPILGRPIRAPAIASGDRRPRPGAENPLAAGDHAPAGPAAREREHGRLQAPPRERRSEPDRLDEPPARNPGDLPSPTTSPVKLSTGAGPRPPR